MKRKAQPAYELPPDLWPAVISRLPVRSLLRFRCVCKSWCSIIDNPNFVSSHLSLCNNNRDRLQVLSSNIVNCSYDTELLLTTQDVDTLGNGNSGNIAKLSRLGFCQIKGYVNGLMLIWRDDNPVPSLYPGELLLCNPSIGKSLTIPPCPAYILNDVLLGFDPLGNDYKVVVLDPDNSQIAIYDLSKGSWRSKSIDFAQEDVELCGCGVFLKGVGVAHCMNADNKNFVSFDFSSETLSFRELPSEGNDYDGVWKQKLLFNLGESLAVFEFNDGGFCIWVMGEGGGSQTWTKWYSRRSLFEYLGLIQGVVYLETCGLFLINTSKAVYSFDIESDQLNLLWKLPQGTSTGCIDTYVESLVLFKGLKGQSLTSFPISKRKKIKG